ncbi:hypothetical protein HDU76_005111 [Blyttiomyces sp. JEL0837]|nr:hypothetical protein HDU76_005111 [Blyttiomyces sp. JEL0837]
MTNTTGTTTYTIVYWDAPGRAELSKFILEKAGATWNNECPDWPAAKSQMPFGQVPVLLEKVDGVEVFRLAQSRAIERYLAKKFDLAGSTPHETALIDSIFESHLDIRTKAMDAIGSSDEERPAKLETYFTKTFPEWLSFHETLLSKNNIDNGAIKGLYTSKFSYVEISAFSFISRLLESFNDQFMKCTNDWENFPNVKALVDLVKNDERINAYLNSDRKLK